MSDCEQLKLTLYQGVPHDCSYLPTQISTLHIVDPQFPMTPTYYGCLMSRGFRRSGDVIYRPACDQCNACKPARIPVQEFTPSRSQKRCRNLNSDIDVRIATPEFGDHHYHLYKAYLETRHSNGEMSAESIDDMERFLFSEWSNIELIEGWKDNELVMVAVTDVTSIGLSAIYTFFDPSLTRHSLGTFGVLSQIARCKELGIPHLYLGYWIKACSKMSYKENFKPLEIFDNVDDWTPLTDTPTPP